MKEQKLALIGAASGWGAQIRTNEDGPSALRSFHLAEKLVQNDIPARWEEIVFSKERGSLKPERDPAVVLPHIVEHGKRVYQTILKSIQKGDFPIAIGGDQSTAVGIWSGIISGVEKIGDFGLVWLDAHMDAHTLETSESQAIHGMPLACLLGHGVDELVHLGQKGAKLNPEHLFLVGIRSYEEGEAALLKRLGVRIYFMEEVRQKGIACVLQEIQNTLNQRVEHFGISVDLDAFDPEESPGVGSPEPGGLSASDTIPALAKLARDPGFSGLEISEYNPHLDQNFKTAQLILELCLSLFRENDQ